MKTLLAVSNSVCIFTILLVESKMHSDLTLKSFLLLCLGLEGVKTEIKVDLSLLPHDEVSVCDICPVRIIYVAF